MNGLDFFLRVLKPWQRDPGFYQTVFAEMSDVPAHEGPSAEPNIDLYNFTYPLSADGRCEADRIPRRGPRLACRRKSQSRAEPGPRPVGLWRSRVRRTGRRAGQARGRNADLNDLDGKRPASLEGATPQLRTAVHNARVATEQFAQWVEAEAPRRTGPSGRRQGQLRLVSEARPAEPL